MKIAITGHCNGLGAAIYNKLTNYNRMANHSVVGFDIQNNYDIGQIHTISKVLYQTKDVDVFINNAYHSKGQTELLKHLLKFWAHKNKTIIHIGTYLINHDIDPNWLPLHKEYVKIKKEQKLLIDNHRKNDLELKIILINPGLMETEFLETMQVPKSQTLIDIFDCADMIVNTIDLLDKNIYIKELTLDNI